MFHFICLGYNWGHISLCSIPIKHLVPPISTHVFSLPGVYPARVNWEASKLLTCVCCILSHGGEEIRPIPAARNQASQPMPLMSLETSAAVGALITEGCHTTGHRWKSVASWDWVSYLGAASGRGGGSAGGDGGWLPFPPPSHTLMLRLILWCPQQSMAWTLSMYINNSLMVEGFWGWRITTPALCLMVHSSIFQIYQMINIPLILNVPYFSTYSHSTYTIISQNSLTYKLNFPNHFFPLMENYLIF